MNSQTRPNPIVGRDAKFPFFIAVVCSIDLLGYPEQLSQLWDPPVAGADRQARRTAAPQLNVKVVGALPFRRGPARIYPAHHFPPLNQCCLGTPSLVLVRVCHPEQTASRACKDRGDDAKDSFAAFIHFFFHRGSPQEFAARKGATV